MENNLVLVSCIPHVKYLSIVTDLLSKGLVDDLSHIHLDDERYQLSQMRSATGLLVHCGQNKQKTYVLTQCQPFEDSFEIIVSTNNRTNYRKGKEDDCPKIYQTRIIRKAVELNSLLLEVIDFDVKHTVCSKFNSNIPRIKEQLSVCFLDDNIDFHSVPGVLENYQCDYIHSIITPPLPIMNVIVSDWSTYENLGGFVVNSSNEIVGICSRITFGKYIHCLTSTSIEKFIKDDEYEIYHLPYKFDMLHLHSDRLDEHGSVLKVMKTHGIKSNMGLKLLSPSSSSLSSSSSSSLSSCVHISNLKKDDEVLSVDDYIIKDGLISCSNINIPIPLESYIALHSNKNNLLKFDIIRNGKNKKICVKPLPCEKNSLISLLQNDDLLELGGLILTEVSEEFLHLGRSFKLAGYVIDKYEQQCFSKTLDTRMIIVVGIRPTIPHKELFDKLNIPYNVISPNTCELNVIFRVNGQKIKSLNDIRRIINENDHIQITIGTSQSKKHSVKFIKQNQNLIIDSLV